MVSAQCSVIPVLVPGEGRSFEGLRDADGKAACFFDVGRYILLKEDEICSNTPLELYYVMGFQARLGTGVYHKLYPLPPQFR